MNTDRLTHLLPTGKRKSQKTHKDDFKQQPLPFELSTWEQIAVACRARGVLSIWCPPNCSYCNDEQLSRCGK